MAFAPFLVKAAVLAVKAFKAKTLVGSVLRAGLQMGLSYGISAVAGALSNQSVGRIDDGSQTTKWEPGTAIPRIYGGEGAGVDVTGIRLPPANVIPLPAIRVDNPSDSNAAFTFFLRATWTRSTNANVFTRVELKWDRNEISFQNYDYVGGVPPEEESIRQVQGGTVNDSNTVAIREANSSFKLRVGFEYTDPNEILWSDWKPGFGTFTE